MAAFTFAVYKNGKPQTKITLRDPFGSGGVLRFTLPGFPANDTREALNAWIAACGNEPIECVYTRENLFDSPPVRTQVARGILAKDLAELLRR